jgi:hypothetical protein
MGQVHILIQDPKNAVFSLKVDASTKHKPTCALAFLPKTPFSGIALLKSQKEKRSSTCAEAVEMIERLVTGAQI